MANTATLLRADTGRGPGGFRRTRSGRRRHPCDDEARPADAHPAPAAARPGHARMIAVCVLLLSMLPTFHTAGAADLQWTALPDRERITLRINPTDGMAGRVDRVAPNAVLVPFTSMPPGLLINNTPEGAKLFQKTMPMGRALALVTQTPEFGFVVTRQNPSELIVDLFPNPLGARWKPTGPATATEIPPDRALQPISPPDAVSEALRTDPEGRAPQSRRLVEAAGRAENGDATPSAASEAAPAAAPGLPAVPPAASPELSAPAAPPSVPPQPTVPLSAPVPAARASAAPSDSGAPAPRTVSVPTLSGTPEHALRATRMSEAPPVEAPRRSELPGPDGNALPRAGSENAGERGTPADRPFQLSLPEPEAVPTQATQPAAPAQTQTTQPAVPTQATQSAAPIHAQTPQLPPQDQVPQAPAPAPPPPEARQARAPRTPPPGVGAPARNSVYAGSINSGGPENISAVPYPDNAGDERSAPPGETGRAEVSVAPGTPPAAQAQDGQSATPAQARDGQAATPAQEAPPAVVYTDDQGNPVEPPPEYAVLHPQMVEHMKAGEFKEALSDADSLLERATLDHEQRGNLLHARSETLFALYKDAVPEHFQELYDAAVKAVNYDPDSRLNSAEYLRLGYMNLHMNNPAEAEANFNMVRRRFADMDNVALTYYYWGDYHYGRNELQKAADQFQHLVREYPNSRYTREASIGLARSLYRMGYYDQAWSVVDYINRRWERFYIQYPPFLNMTADTAYRLGDKDEALKNYWLYVNLEPRGNEADIILTRIGDIYAGKSEKKAAREAYLESAVRYPDKDGGLVARMRMAEEGIHDNPTVTDMFAVFEGPFSLEPQEVYRNIIEKHPGSALVPVAEMKLALWHLWNKDYDRTLELLGDFLKKHPDHELAPRAREIAQQAFAVLAAEGAVEGRGTMLRELWERHPIVRSDPEAMNPESRLALALSYRDQGKPDEALGLVEPFFLGDMLPGYSDTALSMVLGIYLQYEQWNSIREVAKRVEFWNLPAENKRQLDYAVALAEENMGETDAAAELWQRLYDSGGLSPAQHAYAAFFLAMGAERQHRLEQAYHLGREALSGLEEQMQRAPDPADAAKIRTMLASLMDVTESAGRLRESLTYADRYLNSLPEKDPERLAVRYRIARIHKSRGDAETWKSMLTDIAAESPDSVYGKLAVSELRAASIAEDAARYSPTGRL